MRARRLKLTKWRRQAVEFADPAEGVPVPIVGDAAIATASTGSGRLIPLVIVDTSQRRDIDDMILAHGATGLQGRLESRWARPDATGWIWLILTFENPIATSIILSFEIGRQGGVLDCIVRSQGVYIQSGRPGDRFDPALRVPRVLAEVPSHAFQAEWDRLLRSELRKELRLRGAGRSEVKQSVESLIAEWRRLSSEPSGRW
jgi:hypothetical protein